VSEPQLFQTRMGQKFYAGTVPRIASALEEIAKELTAIRQLMEKAAEEKQR
jgi:aminoglycoside/choline kinase family phosphotransferase